MMLDWLHRLHGLLADTSSTSIFIFSFSHFLVFGSVLTCVSFQAQVELVFSCRILSLPVSWCTRALCRWYTGTGCFLWRTTERSGSCRAFGWTCPLPAKNCLDMRWASPDSFSSGRTTTRVAALLQSIHTATAGETQIPKYKYQLSLNEPRATKLCCRQSLTFYCDKLVDERRSSEVLSTQLTDDGPVYHALSVHLSRAKLITRFDDRYTERKL